MRILKNCVTGKLVEKFANFVNAVINEKSFNSISQYINNQKNRKYPLVEQRKWYRYLL